MDVNSSARNTNSQPTTQKSAFPPCHRSHPPRSGSLARPAHDLEGPQASRHSANGRTSTGPAAAAGCRLAGSETGRRSPRNGGLSVLVECAACSRARGPRTCPPRTASPRRRSAQPLRRRCGGCVEP
ncbi:hypothetical protein B0H19DRAFT_1137036 [Mycena capillaripes]|nr:hypothetical protein B0H19DRAFT_1137036 [Mycena capillaripes]